ncbi:Sterol 3-beta-glucosyltransferase [Fusarium irregulare]|uniref:sterol 3beta-glucosyltransferase n=1 Tax=Fusarium irregulare TaxID=2494466 RepID=A0A9W8PZI9_9HYPO|nr:Sterol 3-beta-glucosyltransferase [Fusarium irregulare]KAJ4023788.1 Sterol 3-beta-glucosyltransferase [Fusarium irregulare]
MASQADEAPAPQTSIGEGDLKDHVHDELNKRQRQGSTATVFPEPLRESDDSADEDNGPTQAPPMFMNMNQSIYGLIAQASSRVDFNDRFDGMSSDEEGEGSQQNAKENIAQTSILQPTSKGKEKANRRRKLSDHKLLRSLPALPKLRSKHKSQTSRLSAPVEDADEADNEGDSSGGLLPPPSISRQDTQGRLAPVMSRMLEAKADLSSRPSFDLDRLSSDVSRSSDGDEASALSKKLKEIFEFDEYEQVIEEYPCWLLQSVLLQGYMYITSKHICFYAYLPKKAHEAVKSGYLSKSGKRNPSYARFWFRLKGDVLTYYKTATDVYFPHGQIDLRYGISASIVDKDKEGLHFVVETHSRTYRFKADSAPSAKEWVKSLQRVIFRSHNDGDSVKISLPIKNVMDIEDTQMIAFADTCKIRVIDNDETYAIDEYFFSFFSFGKEAINVLRILIESSSESRSDEKAESGDKDHHGSKSASGRPSRASSKHRTSKLHTGKLPDSVKATLSPMSPVSPRSPGQLSPRVSMDAARSSFDGFRRFGRKSMDVPSSMGDHSPRRSFSGTRHSTSFQHRQGTSTPKQAHDSEDSFLQSSVENPSISTLSPSSYDEPSASQILQGSDVFHSPMMRRSASASRKRDRSGKRTPRNSSAHGERHPGVPHAATTGSLQEMGGEQGDSQRPTTPTLNSITKIGAYPLQRANAFAEYLTRTSQRMGSMFATESLGYVEKVHGMWKGEHRHYDEPRELRTDDDGEDMDSETDDKMQTTVDRFRAHFALPDSEKLVATYFGAIFKVLPLYGKFYISDRSFCFRSLYPGTRTKLILPLKDIENVHKEKGFRLGYSGLTVVIRGHEELFFEFKRQDLRDDCAVTLHQLMETNRFLQQSGVLDQEEQEDEEAAAAIAERDALKEARQDEFVDHELALPRETSGVSNAPTILFDNPNASGLAFKPQKSMRITCLTIGSRGDVQPYIALCKGLLAEGHKPRIATHAEFQGWIESHGIEFARVEGDPGELMRLCIENGTFTWAFLREANSTFRGWLDDLLDSAYTACEGSELLIESPSAMAGIHIAEKLGIPYFRAFTMPWTRTRAYPHAFIMPEHKMGGAYNYMTYVMFDNIFWKATAYQVNRWRNKTLGLPSTSLEKMQPNKVPFLYNFSPSVVAPPLDFSDWIRVTGYWFLDEGGSDWQPPQELQDFITKARADGKKIVYVGFGSIIVKDPAKMTQEVIDAVLKADVRCILSKGWSDRISPKDDPSKPRPDEPEMPPEIHVIKSAPHDWLFSQIDAAAHHGGSGTTGASLRAGIPTIIRPFFGDQFFFATRVEDLGVGVWVKKWGTNSFGRALWEVTRNERMIVKARVLGEQIRSESGVDNAIQCIYRDMEYAKSLIKRKAGKNNTQHDPVEDDDTEESWTFVGRDEPDPDAVTKKLSEGLVGLGAASDHPLPLGSQAPTVA